MWPSSIVRLKYSESLLFGLNTRGASENLDASPIQKLASGLILHLSAISVG